MFIVILTILFTLVVVFCVNKFLIYRKYIRERNLSRRELKCKLNESVKDYKKTLLQTKKNVIFHKVDILLCHMINTENKEFSALYKYLEDKEYNIRTVSYDRTIKEPEKIRGLKFIIFIADKSICEVSYSCYWTTSCGIYNVKDNNLLELLVGAGF